MAKQALFISMLGEREHFRPEEFSSLCPSGLERDWILKWHGPAANQAGFELSGVDICRGDPLPAVDDIDRVILGGTMHVVTEDRRWLHDLKTWLKAYRKTERPLLAICGGHQLISTQFGEGNLTGRSGGTLAGSYEVQLTPRGREHPLFAGLPSNPRFHFANYLHVIPAESQEKGVLAVQPNSPAIAIDHGEGWFTCQFHPESRKQSWDIYYGNLEPDFKSDYQEDHHGQHLISNFFRLT